MVVHVMLAHHFEVTGAEVEMMGGIVGEIIHQVAGDEAGEHRSHPVPGGQEYAHHQPEEAIEKQRQRNADHRRHNQAGFHTRLGVVHAMKEEENALVGRVFGVMVKEKAVQQVFRQGPQEEAQPISGGYKHPTRLRRALKNAAHQEEQDHRQPDDNHRERADVGEKFQKIRFEQANGFFRVVDLNCRHAGCLSLPIIGGLTMKLVKMD